MTNDSFVLRELFDGCLSPFLLLQALRSDAAVPVATDGQSLGETRKQLKEETLLRLVSQSVSQSVSQLKHFVTLLSNLASAILYFD